MKDDAKKPALAVFADMADRTAATHHGHDCAQAPFAKEVARVLREEPTRVDVVSPPEEYGIIFVRGKAGDALHAKASAVDARPCAGPAQVSSAAYRENWETIFGRRIVAGQA